MIAEIGDPQQAGVNSRGELIVKLRELLDDTRFFRIHRDAFDRAQTRPFAATGGAFPFFSAVVGWLGVFLTGSDTSANALFGNLQVVTARALSLNPVLTASVNSAAGVMGKMISIQSIAVAVAATGMSRTDESRLFRFTIKHSVLLMVVMAVISMLYAYVFPQAVPTAP